MLATAAVLTAVFLALGWVQTRQIHLINSKPFYAKENVPWVFSQLEVEYLALRDTLRQAQRYPQHINAEALRERYEIFVSRIALVQPEQISNAIALAPKNQRTLGLMGQFMAQADPFLSENSSIPLEAEEIGLLLRALEPLDEPIYDMSLVTIEGFEQAVSHGNATARKQTNLSIALSLSQALLTLALVGMLIRQVHALQKRSRELGVAREEILRLNGELEERVRQRTAQLEAANRELEAFSYSVSHDLRTPLKSIDGFSHLLERAVADKAGEKGRHYLHRIRAGVRQMGELIDGLLSLAQLSREKMQGSKVDLAAIARSVAQECQERDPHRQARILIQDTMPAIGDPRLLSVILQNLLGNAWKFTSRRDEACIEVGSQPGAAHETVFFVRDNGAGFDMAYAKKLFGTFERLHAPSDFAGTGLGLATVKRIIERHGGRVWAEGRENEGAVFYFTLAPADVPA